jgi:hypothetical protein
MSALRIVARSCTSFCRAPPRRALSAAAATATAAAAAAASAAGGGAAAAAAANAAVERRAYWRRLYEAGDDVFSLPEPNENLARFWGELMPTMVSSPAPPSPLAAAAAAAAAEEEALPRVLVPLCGRDLSMAWMAEEKGVGVLGVDFVGEPLRALAGALGGGLKPVAELRTALRGSAVTVYRSNALPALLLAHGDFLHMRAPDELGGLFDACWDRAALTAVAPGERAEYLARVRAALRPGGRVLLELLSTDADLGGGGGGGGGGGAIEERAALALLASAGLARARVLARRDVRADFPGFRPPGGMRFLDEVVILAERGED